MSCGWVGSEGSAPPAHPAWSSVAADRAWVCWPGPLPSWVRASWTCRVHPLFQGVCYSALLTSLGVRGRGSQSAGAEGSRRGPGSFLNCCAGVPLQQCPSCPFPQVWGGGEGMASSAAIPQPLPHPTAPSACPLPWTSAQERELGPGRQAGIQSTGSPWGHPVSSRSGSRLEPRVQGGLLGAQAGRA